MEKTNSSTKKVVQDEASLLNPAPESVDLRNRVPDLLFMLGMDANKNLREAGFSDSQIAEIYTAIRRCPCFISINFNHNVLDVEPEK